MFFRTIGRAASGSPLEYPCHACVDGPSCVCGSIGPIEAVRPRRHIFAGGVVRVWRPSSLPLCPTKTRRKYPPSLSNPVSLCLLSCFARAQLELPDTDYRFPTEEGVEFKSSKHLFTFSSNGTDGVEAGRQSWSQLTGLEDLQGRVGICPKERIVDGTHANHIMGKARVFFAGRV